MEPQIRFCTSADGTRIAYATSGQGRPLVYVSGWMGNIERDLNDSSSRAALPTLAKRRLLVTYDRRGTGASQREVDEVSIVTEVADLSAVIDCLELQDVDLLGIAEGAAVCVAYAARHPDRVSQLALWGPYPSGEEVFRGDAIRGLTELIHGNWGLARRTLANIVFPEGPTDAQQSISNSLRDSVSPHVAAKHVEFAATVNPRPYIPKVRAKALVFHARGDRNVPISAGRRVAAMMPDATFTALEQGPWMYPDGATALLRALDESRSDGERAAQPDIGALPEGTAVILFADIAGSTALTEQLGDAAFRARARELDTSLRSVIREAGGSPVEGKVLGDGVMAVFTSARQAIDGALRCHATIGGTGLQLHLGIHAGDVIREGNTVYGGAVNIAARIAGASAPGEILVSDTVRSLARTSAKVVYDDRGEHPLKGVGEPQRLFAVTEQA